MFAPPSRHRLCCRDLPRSLLTLLLLFVVLIASGLPAAAFPDGGRCSDQCCESDGASHDTGDDHDGGGAPACPPLCSACPWGAPAVTATVVLHVAPIRDVRTPLGRVAATILPETPPSDGVFHPPRLRA